MGGTGGLGSDRASAEQGLQGAGLLAANAQAPSATMASLGVEDVPQPSSGLLSGSDSAIPVPTGPRSASDTPMPMPVATTPEFLPAGYGLVQAPATSGAFQLAGGSQVSFPTGVTADAPLGTISYKPFAPPKSGPPITGAGVAGAPTGPTIAGGPAAVPAAEAPKLSAEDELWAAWYKAHPGAEYTMSLDDWLSYDIGERHEPYAVPGWQAPPPIPPGRTPDEARLLATQIRQLGQPAYDPRITSG